MIELEENYNKAIFALLNQEQKEKFEKMLEERKESRR